MSQKGISKHLQVDVVTLKCGKKGRRLSRHWVDADGEIISRGFVFDGASAPWFFWSMIPPFKDLEKSCRHDWDCKKARVVMARGGKRNKKVARRIRKEGDIRYGGGFGMIKGFFAYRGVRLGSLFGSGWQHLDYEVVDTNANIRKSIKGTSKNV